MTRPGCGKQGRRRLGTVEAGKLADLVAVAGNPLDDMKALESVEFVMIGGRIVKSPGVATVLDGVRAD